MSDIKSNNPHLTGGEKEFSQFVVVSGQKTLAKHDHAYIPHSFF